MYNTDFPIPGFDLGGFFQQVAEIFNEWYTSAVKATISFLISSSLPSTEEINSDFFKLSFGGFVGLALYFVSAVAIVILIVAFVTPRRDHAKRISRFIGSGIGLILYAFLFFRLYSYVDDASKGLMQVALNFITSSKNGTVDQINNLLTVSTPSGVGSVVVLGIFSVIFCWFAATVAFALKTVVILILVIYPVLIVLRPLGNPAVMAFNAANSLLIVAILSPIMMTWAIALPLVARNVIPGADALGLTALITLVCSAGALLAPIFLMYIFFRLSTQVFGHIDTQGHMAITELPALSWDEAQRNIQDNRTTPMRDAFTGIGGMAVGAAFEEGAMKDLLGRHLPDMAVNAVAGIASAELSPVAGIAIKGAHSLIRSKIDAAKAANASSDIGE